MGEAREQVARRFAAVALTAAYLVVGPAPQLISAMERVYAVAVEDDRDATGPDPDGPYRLHRGPGDGVASRRGPHPARPGSPRP